MAKTVSLIVKCVACVVALLFLTLKAINLGFANLDMSEVYTTVAFCAGLFIDISVNTAIDKFKKKEDE